MFDLEKLDKSKLCELIKPSTESLNLFNINCYKSKKIIEPKNNIDTTLIKSTKTKVINKCITCDKSIDRKAIHCVSCSHIARRKVKIRPTGRICTLSAN